MYEDMRVKYLLINLRYPAYIRMQIATVLACVIGGLLCLLFARDSGVWLLRNGWWLCPVIALLDVGESVLAIRKAKRDFSKKQEGTSPDPLP